MPAESFHLGEIHSKVICNIYTSHGSEVTYVYRLANKTLLLQVTTKQYNR